MFYGGQTWDPLLICGQILAVQALWYLSLGSLLWLLLGAQGGKQPLATFWLCWHLQTADCEDAVTGPYVSHLTLHHVFDWRLVNVHSFTGWMIIVAILFNALAASTYLMALVRASSGLKCHCAQLALLIARWQREQLVTVAVTRATLSSQVWSCTQVERAKKCLDFAATIYIIHATICWSYSGFPLQLTWCGKRRCRICAR